MEQLTPETAVEELLVDEVTSLVWRLRRAARVEAALFTIALPQPVLKALARLAWATAVGVAFAVRPSFATLNRYEAAVVQRCGPTSSALQAEAPTRTLVVVHRGS